MTRTFTPTVQIIDEYGTKTPCLAKIYKDGQWRQCIVHYYKLYPLVAQPLINIPDVSEIIIDKYNRPIYIAKKETK